MQTIRQRTLWVYVPTEEHRARWEKLADKAGLSVSRWILSEVEDHLREAEDESFRPRAGLWKENVQLREANRRLTEEQKMSRALIGKLEDEVRRYRTELFLDGAESRHVRRYEKDLIDLLRSGGVWGSQAILDHLRIKPTDMRSVRAIHMQLENIQAYGLLEATPRG